MVSMDVETNSEDTKENSKRKLNKTVLDNFSNLVKPHEGVRIKSSVNLLKYLSENENDKVNEINYALGRIIRGLGSSSASARTGFYTILVAAIEFHEINLDSIFNVIEKQLHKAGSNTKSENADIATGQILACGAVIRSRLWSASSIEQCERILSMIIKASKERVYLGLLANNFIINSLESLPEKKFQKLFPLIRDEITKPWSEQTLDSLYLLNALENKYSNIINENFLQENFGIRSLISDESFEKLSNILLDIPRLESLKHPFYNIVSKEIAANDLLREFTRHFDSQLSTRNRNRLLVAIKIYTGILESVVKTSHIPSLLSNNFIQHILNYYKNIKDDYEFQKSMHNFFETLLATLKKDQVKSKTKISVLKKLLFYPGTFIFEKITKSKIVQHITSNLDDDGVKNLAALYRGVVTGSERIDSQDEHWLNNDRLYAAHLLVKLLNLPVVKEENDWKVEQLSFLVDLGLFKNDSEVNVGSELAGSLKVTFYGALDLKLSKLDNLVEILLKLFNHIDSKINSGNLETVLRNPISEETYELWQKTAQKITKIEKKRKSHAGLKTVFLVLFLQMGLQLLNDTKLATDSLNELFACYEKSRKSRKHSINSVDETSADESKLEENAEDPIWIEVVIDLFLNLLSHNSHLLRHLVNCVFPHLCQYMTPTAIHQILSVLDPKNEDNPLSKNNSDSSDDDESDKEDDEEKAENGLDVKEDENSESEDEDSESEDDEANEADEKETVNERLRMALHEALSKNGGYQSDEESVDLDNISETEGKELDKALADAFRQFKPNRGKHKKQSKDEETLTHFRIRALDLIEIYLNSTPSMQLSLEIMLPLLQAVEFSVRDDHQIPLHNRLKSTLKKLTNLKKFSDTDGVDDTVLGDLLKGLLEKGTKTVWIVQDMRVEIAQCCTFIIKCSDIMSSLETTPKKVKKKLKSSLVEIILSELDNYFHKRDCLTPIVLFKNVLGLSWDGCISMIPPLFQYVFEEEVKAFKRNQAAELLRIFYQNQRFLSISKEKITEALQDQHEQFSENIIKFFVNLNKNPDDNIKEKFVCNLFHLVTAVKTCCLNVDNVNWKEISETIREYRSGVTFSNDAKKAFNKCANRLGISNVVKMKPRTIKLNGTTENKSEGDAKIAETSNTKRKIKKTKNKEKLKLKKEAKQVRLQSLSEGLGDAHFSEVDTVKMKENESRIEEFDITENEQFSENDEEEMDTKKKNKQKRKKRKSNETFQETSESIISKPKRNKFQH